MQKQDGDMEFDPFEEGLLEKIGKLEDDSIGVETKLRETLQLATQKI